MDRRSASQQSDRAAPVVRPSELTATFGIPFRVSSIRKFNRRLDLSLPLGADVLVITFAPSTNKIAENGASRHALHAAAVVTGVSIFESDVEKNV